jgi:hypothetical protein
MNYFLVGCLSFGLPVDYDAWLLLPYLLIRLLTHTPAYYSASGLLFCEHLSIEPPLS